MESMPQVEPHFGWAAQAIEQDASGVRVTDRERSRRRRPRGARRRLRRRLRRRPLDRARTGRHQARRRGFRSGHGARGVSLTRAERGPRQALSVALDLSRAASGSERLLAILRPHRHGRRLVLPLAGPARTRRARISISPPYSARSRDSISPASSITSASGTCASRSPNNIAPAAFSSPAMRRIRIRPMAASALTTASRMSPISAGSSPRASTAGAAKRCSIPTTRSAARCSGSSAMSSSPPASRGKAS